MNTKATKQLPRFATGQAHDAALDATYLPGAQFATLPQPLDIMVPPRPYTDEELFLRGVISAPVSRRHPGWAMIDTQRADARFHWRTQDRMPCPCAEIPGVGILVLRGAGPGKGYEATLLRAPDGKTVTGHALVRASSGRPVRFDDREQATRALTPVLMSGGRLPAGWAWNPPWGAQGAVWTPVRRDGAEIYWRGRSARWIVIQSDDLTYWVMRGRKPVTDDAGGVRSFDTAKAAKGFCERSDT